MLLVLGNLLLPPSGGTTLLLIQQFEDFFTGCLYTFRLTPVIICVILNIIKRDFKNGLTRVKNVILNSP